MNSLSVAIVGAGNMAGGYDEKRLSGDAGIFTHAGAFSHHGGFGLKTVFDPDGKRATNFAGIWKVGRTAVNLDEICSGFHDVVSVCSPDQTHFEIVRDLLVSRCCRTVFVEKPLSRDIGQIEDLIRLAEQCGIHVVVNFQRRHEEEHRSVRDHIAACPGGIASISGNYMKGLVHSGTTMIDTLNFLCGFPDAVLAFNRVLNREINDYSYEFVLYYPNFTASVKTTDADRFDYNYHIFEIDLLLTDSRITFVDVSQGIREASVTQYVYSGVKVMNDREAKVRETKFKTAMVEAVGYVHEVTLQKRPHEINTLASSYNNSLIVNRIIESLNRGAEKLAFEKSQWKK